MRSIEIVWQPLNSFTYFSLFFLSAALNIFAIATAMPVIFALHKEKIALKY
jgi:hypothetical protein